MVLSSPYLRRRLMGWALARTLEAPVLLPFMRMSLYGLVAGLAGGILLTLSCTSLLGVLYLFLNQQEDMAPALALLIVAGVTFFVAGGFLFFAQKQLKKNLKGLNGSVARAAAPPALEETVLEIPRVLLQGFLEGVLGRNSSTLQD